MNLKSSSASSQETLKTNTAPNATEFTWKRRGKRIQTIHDGQTECFEENERVKNVVARSPQRSDVLTEKQDSFDTYLTVEWVS